jgi:hypothetical protein
MRLALPLLPQGHMLALPLAGVLVFGCAAGDECEVDGQCPSGEVCARDHSCLPPSQVRSVRAEWTVDGEPADRDSCDGRSLFIEFRSTRSGDTLGYQPVPCFTGQFTVDKLPLRFQSVVLGLQGGGARTSATFDADGIARLDLRF